MRWRQAFYLAAFFSSAILTTAAAQTDGNVAGSWLTENGKGIIAIAPCGQSICGRILWMKPPPTARPGEIPYDKKNPDPSRRKQPLCGSTILYDFHRDPSNPLRWEDGAIYDPDSGSTYHATVTIQDPDHLRLRGYIGIPLLGESQIWTRADPHHPLCHAG